MAIIRTGLIGFGLGGSAFHAPLIQAVKGLELAAVATSRADQVRVRYPHVAVTTPEILIADPAVELVVVSTPNDTHHSLARAALEAGKHVVIDKPFATSVAEAEDLIALGAEKGRRVVPFHNRRWDSDFLTVRKLLQDDLLGEVMLFEAHWDRFRPQRSQPWKEAAEAGGGQLADLGPHMIDQALVLFGTPDHVTGDIAAQRSGSAVDDYFGVTLHYGERRVTLSSSRLVAAPRPRFSIHGRKASFVKHGVDPQEAALRNGCDPNSSEYGVEPSGSAGVLTRGDGMSVRVESQRGDYRRFYDQLAAALRRQGPLPVDPHDALIGLRLIEQARTSSREGTRLPSR